MSDDESFDESSQSIINIQTDQADAKSSNLPLFGNTLITELDFNTLQGEKPWRQCRTKEELAQYFNYGFDEVTFRIYQRFLKEEKQNKGVDKK